MLSLHIIRKYYEFNAPPLNEQTQPQKHSLAETGQVTSESKTMSNFADFTPEYFKLIS